LNYSIIADRLLMEGNVDKKDKSREACRQYYAANRDRISARRKAWYYANRERLLVDKKEYAKRNPHMLGRRRKTDKAYALWQTCRHRARKKNLPFDLFVEDIVIPERCPALGIPLISGSKGSMDNWPSVDRKVPELGYVRGNICVISYKANRMKSNGTLEELINLVRWLTGNSQ